MKVFRTRCETSACVEVISTVNGVVIRSNQSQNSVLRDGWVEVTWDEWAHFVRGVKAGDFDEVVPGPFDRHSVNLKATEEDMSKLKDMGLI